jgi:hypothetical protein
MKLKESSIGLEELKKDLNHRDFEIIEEAPQRTNRTFCIAGNKMFFHPGQSPHHFCTMTRIVSSFTGFLILLLLLHRQEQQVQSFPLPAAAGGIMMGTPSRTPHLCAHKPLDRAHKGEFLPSLST